MAKGLYKKSHFLGVRVGVKPYYALKKNKKSLNLEEDKMRNSFLTLLLIAALTLTSLVGAVNDNGVDVLINSVEINGDDVLVGFPVLVDKGDTLNIRVGITANLNRVEDLELDAKISGYEYSDNDNLYDSTSLFDVPAGTTKYVNLEIGLPRDMEGYVYTLRLRLLDQNGAELLAERTIYVESQRHGVDFADVSISSTVRAGRSLFTRVLLENFGEKDQENVKVTVGIPELGMSATEYVDLIESGKYANVPEMFIQIPASAEEGIYAVQVTVRYNGLRESVSEQYSVTVLPYEFDNLVKVNEEASVLAVAPESQTVAAGSTAVYGVALANEGQSSKAYTVEVVTGDWASASVSESLVVLESGKSQVVYVKLAAAENAPTGAHTASVVVKSGDEVLETLTLGAEVVPAQNGNTTVGLKNGLEIALIVLVVLLVVIGLIIGFSRLRKEEDDEQTYY